MTIKPKSYVSISLRLTLWFGAIFFCGSVIFGAAMWVQLKNTLMNERRLTLSRRADRLKDLLLRDQLQPKVVFTDDFRDFATATGNGLAEILLDDKQKAYPSPSSAASEFPWPVNDAPARFDSFLQVRKMQQPYLVLIRKIILNGRTAYIFLASPSNANLLILHDFWRGLLAWIPVVLMVSSAGGYWMSRRALQPVDRITVAVRSISIGNLGGRLRVNRNGDELQRLTETCNEMLQRLEDSVNRMKQFTADASHELRGPLSFMRTVAEIALRNPAIDLDSRRSFQDIVDEGAKATGMLEQMLTLARADAEPLGRQLKPVDLNDIVNEAFGVGRKLAEEKGLTIKALRIANAVPVLGDPPSLRRLVWILMDNAIKYTGAHGEIRVAVASEDGRVRLSVMNSGPGISPADLPHVFDRFYRADPSRSQVEGSGLGLAIAKWIAEAHDAKLSAKSEVNTSTIFLVDFPAMV